MAIMRTAGVISILLLVCTNQADAFVTTMAAKGFGGRSGGKAKKAVAGKGGGECVEFMVHVWCTQSKREATEYYFLCLRVSTILDDGQYLRHTHVL